MRVSELGLVAFFRIVLLFSAVLPPAWAACVFLRPPFPAMFGGQALWPGGLCAAWGIAAAVFGVLQPATLLLSAPAGAALAIFMSRGRLAAALAQERLPPGRMAFAAGVRALASRSFHLRTFSRLGPVFKTTQFGVPVICVAGMDRICRLMRGHAADLGPSPLAFMKSIKGNFLRYMDDETHSRYGGLFRRAMAGVGDAGTEAKLGEACSSFLAALAERGPCHPGTGLRLLTRSSLDLLLFGFGGDDARSREFGDLADQLYPADIGRPLSPADRRLINRMAAILAVQAEEAHRGDGAPVLAKLRALDPGMPDRVCLENLIVMHKIGTNNVSSLLLWLIHWWGARPEVVAQVRARQGGARAAALSAFLHETLRLGQSEYLYRKVTRSFDFEGFRFPAGWLVRSCIWESHRTTSDLEEPGEFRLRLGPEDYARDHFAPFGMGRHACNGVEATECIGLSLLAVLADGYDVEVRGAEPPQRLMRHWSHWQPNRAMTVRVTPV